MNKTQQTMSKIENLIHELKYDIRLSSINTKDRVALLEAYLQLTELTHKASTILDRIYGVAVKQ